MVPAGLATTRALLNGRMGKLLTFMEGRLSSDLGELHLVSVSGRPKSSDSILQKLHTGQYPAVDSLKDLVGLTVVLLYRREIHDAIEIAKKSGLTVVGEPTRAIAATDFRYREPKLYLKPPPDYLERNPDVRDITCEVQFTTAVQHALDMTTHDFDYKGRTYSWQNFRLVAQLRGMLELVDQIIDDIEGVSMPNHEIVEAPPDLVFASSILDVISSKFDEAALPNDRRRLADTVAAWTTAAGLSAEEFQALLENHDDLVSANSLDPTSAILGCLLREHMNAVVSNFQGLFFISSELESFCSEAASVPPDRRVTIAVS